METRPYLSFGLMQLMTGYLQEMQERYRELATERVERRIALTVLRLAAQIGKRSSGDETMVELPLSRQDVAEASGTTIFTVSRVLADWERRGLVEAGRERVVIRNPHGLVQVSEGLDQ
jgi:CRP-like cAMP-binding protein